MNTFEHMPQEQALPDQPAADFDFAFPELDSMDMDGFDINAAFQEAVQGIVSDTELAIEEKIRRMEVIISEGTSEAYRDFVDFRQLAAHMQMMCAHDHTAQQSLGNSDTLSEFMNEHTDHDDTGKHDHHDEEDYEIDPVTGKKKKKKKRGWFGVRVDV